MISNQILQSTMEGIKSISRTELAVTDVEGNILVSTFPETEISRSEVINFARSQADSQSVKNYQFLKFMMNISWSMFCLQKETMKTYSLWEKWQHFRFRICW